ncbi:MAG: hypothetical protein LBQ24_04665 [Candidatus Peribacteria bacterium]|jgi:hypothetical protein|nr:hypothetical protein [Candidatus Peribacteria bacterium]
MMRFLKINYKKYKTIAVIIQTKLQAKASLGKCHKDSLNFFFHKILFIALACFQASYLTFMAS